MILNIKIASDSEILYQSLFIQLREKRGKSEREKLGKKEREREREKERERKKKLEEEVWRR